MARISATVYSGFMVWTDQWSVGGGACLGHISEPGWVVILASNKSRRRRAQSRNMPPHGAARCTTIGASFLQRGWHGLAILDRPGRNLYRHRGAPARRPAAHLQAVVGKS